MDVRELVTTHYGARDLSDAILEALASAGVDMENLEADDLYPVDQLHAGGMAATSTRSSAWRSVRARGCSTSAVGSVARPGWRRRTTPR